jgi:hypothetical protein
MNQTILEEARAALAAGPMLLTTLHERLKNAGSAWSESQHHLFFLAFDEFSVAKTGDQIEISSGSRSYKDSLLLDIEEVVDSFAGNPMPAKEIRKRLPTEYVTTDEQIKSIVKDSGSLEVYGPGLIRKK